MPARPRWPSAGLSGRLLAAWTALAPCLLLAAAVSASPTDSGPVDVGTSCTGLGSPGLLSSVPATVYTTDCANGATFCLSADGEATVYANGRELETQEVCATRDYLRLDLNAAFAGLSAGPFQVVWRLEPGASRMRIEDRGALLDFLRESAPEASWRSGEKGYVIGLPDERYGELTIVDAGSGENTETGFDTVAVATDRSYVLPVGTHHLIAETSEGRDTTVLHVLCTPTTRRDVRVVQGLRESHCLPADAPPDTYEVSVLEAPDADVIGEVDLLGLCLEFVGRSAGKTVGRYERCHKTTDQCERFEVHFEVIRGEDLPPPTPQNDYAALAHGGQDVIDVLVNDVVPGTVGSLVISQDPDGNARVDAKHRIHYSAPAGWCGRDSLRYIVCNEGGCEEALVRIEVACEKLVVFSGFSPNGDGVNDAFTVLGLENYPDNSVVVFNQYGQQVFRATGYANDWEGTSKGSHLSEDTYYYVVQAKGFRTLSGYVQLQR